MKNGCSRIVTATLLLVFLFLLTSCFHEHSFGEWTTVTTPTCTSGGLKRRTCACGEEDTVDIPAFGHMEGVWVTEKEASCTEDGIKKQLCAVCKEALNTEVIAALGHTEGKDAAVAPTCIALGKTEGSHCKRCKAVIVEQTDVPAKGHRSVTDPALSPTCTKAGKTEGAHCEDCGAVLVPQTPIPAVGHSFGDGVIVTEATCTESGTKKYTCTASGCGFVSVGSYALPKLEATELYNQALAYVGEITTFDKNGNALALGTGFVISSNGRLVTNYHVIEGAYSATVCIKDKAYEIVSVLAYDADIDLAVLKIDVVGFTAATVCKKDVATGETVYAIGSSRGMTNTYSMGIVTQASRVVDGVTYVQHDASITNGNSGGPLLNVYGEVIGINTWGLLDSQNLNFAVFTGELDKLNYDTPLTMAELYDKECNAFERMKNYVVENGAYSSEGDCYQLILGTTYSPDASAKYTRVAYYYVSDDTITLDFLIDDGDMWVYFVIDETVNGSYFWKYFDKNDYEMKGTLNAATFHSQMLLGYSDHNVGSSSLRSSIRELASAMVNLLCTWIDDDFSAIGVTAEDLGFLYY